MTGSRIEGSRKTKTGGRTAGTPNKKTQEQVKAVEETGITPLQFLLSVMRAELPPEVAQKIKDKNQSLDMDTISVLSGWYDRRIDAAGKAAPYVHAKLVAIHQTDGTKMSLDAWLSLPDDE